MLDIPSYIPPPFEDGKSVDPMPSGYDWPAFMTAYGAGRWDPHRTPNPPVSAPELGVSRQDPEPPTPRNPSIFDSWMDNSSFCNNQQRSPPIPVPTLGVVRNSIKSRTALMPLHLPIPAHRARNLLSASLPNHPVADQISPFLSVPQTNVQTTVATMRWAAARVDISPLALPSPEHELTDPMRGVTATIPGSHSRDSSLGSDLITPGGTRRLRLPSFWRGTTDVENAKLVPIEGSPSELNLQPINMVENLTQKDSAVLDDDELGAKPLIPSKPPSPIIQTIPSASILSEVHPHADSTLAPTDYFGSARLPPPDFLNVGFQSSRIDKPREPASAPAASTATQVALHARADDDSTIHLQLRRMSLTRQSSSPLPVKTSPDANNGTGSRLLGGRVLEISNDKNGGKPGWAARFEQCFSNLGYLLPPSPPDELERRRALYKYVQVINELQPLMTFSDSTFGTLAQIKISIALFISSSLFLIQNVSSCH